MKKRFLALTMASLMAFSMVGCSGGNKEAADTTAANGETQAAGEETWQILKNETHVYFCRDICEDIRYRNIRGVSFFDIFNR